jgi:hypothetical protein
MNMRSTRKAFNDEMRAITNKHDVSISYNPDDYNGHSIAEIDFMPCSGDINLDDVLKIINIAKKYELIDGSFSAPEKSWIRITLVFPRD